jgi:hypothetical protein
MIEPVFKDHIREEQAKVTNTRKCSYFSFQHEMKKGIYNYREAYIKKCKSKLFFYKYQTAPAETHV